MYVAFFAVCIAGVLGMSWGFPLLAALCRRCSAIRFGAPVAPHGMRMSFTVLIPAHNEAESLPATLDSLTQAIETARTKYPDFACTILIGADGCDDNTELIASARGISTLSFRPALGKWRVLKELVSRCPDAGMAVLSDSGTAFPPNFFLELLLYCSDVRVVGLAPGYCNARGGRLENILWAMERHFKYLENFAGGPVSVHGACVVYRLETLRRAFNYLDGRQWLNDDVTIPVTLHIVSPDSRIIYLPHLLVRDQAAICDRAESLQRGEAARRRRMVMGNAEWITQLWPALVRTNAPAALVSCRRIFRLFWAYWILFIGLAIWTALLQSKPLAAGLVLGLALVLTLGAAARAPALRALAAAAGASLRAPLVLLTPPREVAWK